MIDWHNIINDLNGRGINCVMIAERCGSRPSTITSLKGNWHNEPRYSLGQKLLALHKLHCPEKHREVA